MFGGTCLTLAEVRQQAGKAGMPVKGASDYEIHQLAVENAENNKHPLSQRLQKLLEKKFAVAIRQFRSARDEVSLMSQRDSGWRYGQVAGSLWALITHPLTTRAIILEVFGQVHMMSQLSGASSCMPHSCRKRWRNCGRPSSSSKATSCSCRWMCNAWKDYWNRDWISHSAMQKARTLCVKQDKPMIFMQRSSLSPFTRSLYETLS